MSSKTTSALIAHARINDAIEAQFVSRGKNERRGGAGRARLIGGGAGVVSVVFAWADLEFIDSIVGYPMHEGPNGKRSAVIRLCMNIVRRLTAKHTPAGASSAEGLIAAYEALTRDDA